MWAVPSQPGRADRQYTEKYEGLTGAAVRTGCEVYAVHPEEKTVSVRDLRSGAEFTESYDKLVIASGAKPFVPPMGGTDLPGVFCLRTPEDAEGLRDYIDARNCSRAVVVGAGFIGLEAAENLKARGLSVTVLDAADQIMPNAFDREMAGYVQRQLQRTGMRVLTSTAIRA